VALAQRLHRGLPRRSDRFGQGHDRQERHQLRHLRQDVLAQQRRAEAAVPGRGDAGQLPAALELDVDAHWTLQLENDGTFEGEAANTPGSSTFIGDYPEVYGGNWDRQNADGRLNDFQRHKVRAWTAYGLQLGRFGSLDSSVSYRFNSAQTYSLAATGQALSAIQLARNPGYARASGQAQTIFFDERGSESFKASNQVDVAFLYQVPLWKTLRPWFKAEFYNVFNNQPLVLANTAVTPDAASALDADGLRTGYIKPAAFGTARSQGDYPRATTSPAGTALYARTFLMSFGLRF
jgi:hypothetical protein